MYVCINVYFQCFLYFLNVIFLTISHKWIISLCVSCIVLYNDNFFLIFFQKHPHHIHFITWNVPKTNKYRLIWFSGQARGGKLCGVLNRNHHMSDYECYQHVGTSFCVWWAYPLDHEKVYLISRPKKKVKPLNWVQR